MCTVRCHHFSPYSISICHRLTWWCHGSAVEPNLYNRVIEVNLWGCCDIALHDFVLCHCELSWPRNMHVSRYFAIAPFNYLKKCGSFDWGVKMTRATKSMTWCLAFYPCNRIPTIKDWGVSWLWWYLTHPVVTVGPNLAERLIRLL